MTKTICDKCGHEIQKSTLGDGLNREFKKMDQMSVEVHKRTYAVVKLEKVREDGEPEADLCHYCVVDALKTLDDRPKAG